MRREERIARDQMHGLIDVVMPADLAIRRRLPSGSCTPTMSASAARMAADLVEGDLHAAVPDVEGHHGERLRRGPARGDERPGQRRVRGRPAGGSAQYQRVLRVPAHLIRLPIPQRSSSREREVFCSRATTRAPGAELDDHLGRRADVDALDDRSLNRDMPGSRSSIQIFSGRTKNTSPPGSQSPGIAPSRPHREASLTPPVSTVAGSRFDTPMKPATKRFGAARRSRPASRTAGPRRRPSRRSGRTSRAPPPGRA